MPFLIFVKGDEVTLFKGKNIDGLAVIRGTDYERNGKWSHTTYRLEVVDGIRHIMGMTGWETGRFLEGLGAATSCGTPDTWSDAAKALGVSVPSAMEFLRANWPNAASELDKVEQSLAALEESVAQPETDAVIVTVSFGSPSNRAIREGFWESPKGIPGYHGEIRKIEAEQGWVEGNITVVGIAGTVLSVKHSLGMHGGYYAVSVAVVPGTETEIPPFETAREKAAKESGLPERLFRAFGGDVDLVKSFIAKVENLDATKLDQHEMSCGRERQRAEVVRVSGDPEFFLGADPLELCWYIMEGNSSSTSTASNQSSVGGNAFGDAFRKAGIR